MVTVFTSSVSLFNFPTLVQWTYTVDVAGFSRGAYQARILAGMIHKVHIYHGEVGHERGG